MKTNFILLTLLGMSLLWGCSGDYTATYQIANSTANDVQIYFFSEYYDDDTITVNANETLDFTVLHSEDDRVGLTFEENDSIEFSNGSVLVVLYDDDSANFFQTDNDSIWEVTRNKKRNYTYIYTITDRLFAN